MVFETWDLGCGFFRCGFLRPFGYFDKLRINNRGFLLRRFFILKQVWIPTVRYCIMFIVLLTNRKDYEPFLANVVFAFDGLGNFGIISHRFHRF